MTLHLYISSTNDDSLLSRDCQHFGPFPSPSPPIDNIWAMMLSGDNRGDYQNCFVLYCVLKLCTVISTLTWAVLTVLWIGLSHWTHFTVRRLIYLCLSLRILYVFVSYCIVVVELWARWGWPDGIEGYSFGSIFLQCFDTVGWVIWPVKTRPQYDL